MPPKSNIAIGFLVYGIAIVAAAIGFAAAIAVAPATMRAIAAIPAPIRAAIIVAAAIVYHAHHHTKRS